MTKTVVGTTANNGMDLDDFMLVLTGLKPNTTYYFKAYAGDAESIVRSFKTLSAPSSLELSASAWNVSGQGESTRVTVMTSNVDWTASSDISWLTVTTASPSNGNGDGVLILTAEANTVRASRSGVITVTAGSLTKTIRVTQAGTSSTRP